MYGGGSLFDPVQGSGVEVEDPEKLAVFEARIQRGEKIEPAD